MQGFIYDLFGRQQKKDKQKKEVSGLRSRPDNIYIFIAKAQATELLVQIYL